MESVRKDVECTFGILKCRFRILRNPIPYASNPFAQPPQKLAFLLADKFLMRSLVWKDLE
jgi:hypothetical protein